MKRRRSGKPIRHLARTGAEVTAHRAPEVIEARVLIRREPYLRRNTISSSISGIAF
jgi:hypothetical protein